MLLKRGVASWLTAKALLRSALLCSHAVRMSYILMNPCPSNHNLSAATCRQNASPAGRPESCTALFAELTFAVFFFLGFFSETSLTCLFTPFAKRLSPWGKKAVKIKWAGLHHCIYCHCKSIWKFRSGRHRYELQHSQVRQRQAQKNDMIG